MHFRLFGSLLLSGSAIPLLLHVFLAVCVHIFFFQPSWTELSYSLEKCITSVVMPIVAFLTIRTISFFYLPYIHIYCRKNGIKIVAKTSEKCSWKNINLKRKPLEITLRFPPHVYIPRAIHYYPLWVAAAIITNNKQRTAQKRCIEKSFPSRRILVRSSSCFSLMLLLSLSLFSLLFYIHILYT